MEWRLGWIRAHKTSGFFLKQSFKPILYTWIYLLFRILNNQLFGTIDKPVEWHP